MKKAMLSLLPALATPCKAAPSSLRARVTAEVPAAFHYSSLGALRSDSAGARHALLGCIRAHAALKGRVQLALPALTRYSAIPSG